MTTTNEDLSYLSGQSMSASFNAPTIDMRDHRSICIEVWWTTTNTPVGKLKLESSVTGDRWDTEGTEVETSGRTSVFFKLSGTHEGRKLRLVYTRESGGSGAVMNAAYIVKNGGV